ncbi:hypothetical protein HXX76_006745 [Chlamydomonas incerta]|uniref:Uncharacterized protein n=1 Tax=Chlamydomonas incerta TaxID=51695 RepID=A0A835T3N1_CHLIN|nr:hypothetical protein HXX76_006745 [Chlamydomonas incerta]|eukprot:KAG2436442.1 hypothetical protein HXX76_006745 [Chlamydomonas incerta]
MEKPHGLKKTPASPARWRPTHVAHYYQQHPLTSDQLEALATTGDLTSLLVEHTIQPFNTTDQRPYHLAAAEARRTHAAATAAYIASGAAAGKAAPSGSSSGSGSGSSGSGSSGGGAH